MINESGGVRDESRAHQLAEYIGYDNDDLRAENYRLRAGIEQLQNDILRLSRVLESTHQLNEEVAALREDAILLRAVGQSHLERGEQLGAELEKIRGETEQWASQLSQLRGEAHRLREEVQLLLEETQKLRAAEQACRDENAKLEAVSRSHCERIGQLVGELDALYASSSWRLTRPLRWIRRCFSRIIPR